MKTLRLNTLAKKVFLGVFTLLFLISVETQAKKIRFQTSSVVPAARGYVKITKDKNQNYVIKMNLSNLAEVQRVDPSKLSYVVWMFTDRNETKNIGRLISSKKFMSKKLKTSFKTVSSFKPTQIFITTEVDSSIQNPGSELVLTTKRFTN